MMTEIQVDQRRLAGHFLIHDGSDGDVLEINLPVSMGGTPINLEDFRWRAQMFAEAINQVRSNVHAGMAADDIMPHFYEAGKATYSRERLRDWFRDIYLVLSDSPDGVRVGQLVEVWGVDEFFEAIQSRLNSL
jgi:hypothetical protein